MAVERERVLNNELIKEACILCNKAHSNQHYVTKKHGSSIIFSFKESTEVTDLFGEAETVCNLFPSLRRIGEGQLAKVNGSFLKRFQDLLKNSKFKSEVEKAVSEKKKIILTGHSSGGAVASLATLWILDEYIRTHKISHPIACVTFGSPLLGDGTLTHAVRREKWASHFTHVIMEHDIVPRMMLAPKTSVQEHLPAILKFFQHTTKKSNKITKIFNKKAPGGTSDDDDDDENQVVGFFEKVLVNSSTVASHDAYDLMEPTNSLKEKLASDFVKVSPYRPFGVYVFCTRGEDLGASVPRQQLVVENPNAVLQLLFYFLQLPNEDQDLTQFALESLHENLSYEEELNNNGLQLEYQVKLEGLVKDLWTYEGITGDVVRRHNKALFELAASAKWCLLAVEEAENRKKKNEEDIKKSMKSSTSNQTKTAKKNVEDMLKEIHEYKVKLGDGNHDYYQAFKLQNEHTDFEANVNRLEQAKIWDVIIEMVMRKDLPDGFEVDGDVVELGTRFRRLYEPLDIANYYRHAKGDDTGVTYMKVRPKRYKFTQTWYQHANVMKFEADSESNFVSEIEELMKKKTDEEVNLELEKIVKKVNKWKSDDQIKKAYGDVFWGDSVFSKLQEKRTELN